MLAYFDCFSGISGDMTLGALIDLGVPVTWLTEQIERLPLAGFEIQSKVVHRHGIHARRVKVKSNDVDTSRDYATISALIENSPLTKPVKARSLEMFQKIASAEAGIHGCPIEQVHFHEVGGIDAIVDIVGTALGMAYLSVDKTICSKIPLGTGFVQCRHGTIPIPAPATAEILKGIPVVGSKRSFELVTPTGAAIVSTLADGFEPIPEMRIHKIGYGAGKMDSDDIPNVLRVMVGTMAESATGLSTGRVFGQITVVETCLDDMNPEICAYTMERLFEDGAVDVYWTPVYMKKNRPGMKITVLCHGSEETSIIDRILTETTSTGVRYFRMDRQMLDREKVTIETAFGPVTVKKIIGTDGNSRIVPEYEECKRIAQQVGIPIRDVYEIILKTP